MKHFALVVRTATSKRCQKISLLHNSDLLHEVQHIISHVLHVTHDSFYSSFLTQCSMTPSSSTQFDKHIQRMTDTGREHSHRQGMLLYPMARMLMLMLMLSRFLSLRVLNPAVRRIVHKMHQNSHFQMKKTQKFTVVKVKVKVNVDLYSASS